MKIASALIAGLITLGASYVWAETDPQSKPSIDKPVSTVHMDVQGNIKQIKFADGSVVKEPQTDLREKPIERVDVVRTRQLSFGTLTFANPGLPGVCPGPRCLCTLCPDGCKFFKTLRSDETYVIYLDPQGEIEHVEYPDGSVENASSLRHEHPLKDVNILEYRPYTLIETRDTSTGETKVRVLEPFNIQGR
jgi:hypothetical protein